MGFMITVAGVVPMALIAVIGVVVAILIIMGVPVIVAMVVSVAVMVVWLRGRRVKRFGEPAIHPDPVYTGMGGREAKRRAPLGVRLNVAERPGARSPAGSRSRRSPLGSCSSSWA